MTNVTPVSPTPEVALAPARAPEPSMFDAPDWINNPDPVQQPGPKFAGVRFQPVGKVYTYIADSFPQLKTGDWVIVDTARGKQMGQVATVKRPRAVGDMSTYKRIERLAGGRDMVMRHYYENKELEAMIACRAESKALDMPIKIVRAEYSFDGQSLTFLFSSDQEERIETSELRQVMSRLYRARIELRQISPREVAKVIGGMGACGIEQRCCSRFLNDFSPISIKHAKEQGLSLNPHDITGMCGRLRCCLIYEYEQYVEARRKLPKKNAIIGTPSGQGKVIDHMPLRDAVLVLIGEGETAKVIEVHRQYIVPLEELKRLQDKAASGTCDKHEGGNCDCGKNKSDAPDAPGAAATTATPVDQAAVVASVAPLVAAPGAPSQANAVRYPRYQKKDNGPARPERSGRPNRQNRQDSQARPDREARGQQGQPAPNKANSQPGAGQNRHTLTRPKRGPDRDERPARPAEPARRQSEPSQGLPDITEPRAQNQGLQNTSVGSPMDLNGDQQADQQNHPVRRPLRRPLQRHPSSTGTTGSADQPSQSTQES